MKQYHNHLKEILENGWVKPAARANMPGSISRFGHTCRYNLADGFPILTTKKVNFNNIVTELLWFLRGDTNIKYLDENGVRNLWHQDAYNYYVKLFENCKDADAYGMFWWESDGNHRLYTFEEFCETIKTMQRHQLPSYGAYQMGDCGYQYGKLWRSWDGPMQRADGKVTVPQIDQIRNVVSSIKKGPDGRRHIVTAWDPAHLNDMALNACHALFQFNCRRLPVYKILNWIEENAPESLEGVDQSKLDWETLAKHPENPPLYYLDCLLYQRSADMFLGVPYNLSSYALLTHMVAKVCRMVPGEFIHTFGDSHIYDNHMEQVREILTRDTEKYPLPSLKFHSEIDWDGFGDELNFNSLRPWQFWLEGYQSYPAIKAKLSTGLK
jgi:thymidylate synthase